MQRYKDTFEACTMWLWLICIGGESNSSICVLPTSWTCLQLFHEVHSFKSERYLGKARDEVRKTRQISVLQVPSGTDIVAAVWRLSRWAIRKRSVAASSAAITLSLLVLALGGLSLRFTPFYDVDFAPHGELVSG